MKSIKEKAEEIFPIEERDSLETELKRRKMRQCYEHGANYVIDEIKSLIKNVSDEYPRFQQGTIIHIRLIKLLEQLKK